MSAVEAHVLEYLVNALWQIPLLTGVAWLVARIMRPAGAAFEHRVWVTTLVLEAVLPACAHQQWMALPVWFHVAGLSAPGGRVSVVLGDGQASGAGSITNLMLVSITTIYGASLLYFSTRLLWRIGRLGGLRRSALPVPLTGVVSEVWTSYVQEFNLHGAALAQSEDVFGPSTIGVRRKLVLIPAGLLQYLSVEELRIVVAHEFAHMVRNDFAKNLLYELLSISVRWHPLYAITWARLVESREVVCDQMAADVCTGREEYARSLLRLAARLLDRPKSVKLNAIGMFDANALERRITMLTTLQSKLNSVRRTASIAACILCGLCTCTSAIALRVAVKTPTLSQDTAGADAAKVAGGVMAGNIISKVAPTYPAEAKQAHISGTVILKAVIGKSGSIESLTVMSGPPELTASAVDAVRQWIYKPYLLNGEPVDVETTITVTYSLAQ